MIVLAILLFFMLFFVVGTYKECSNGVSSGSSWDRDGYKFTGSINSSYNSTHPGNRIKGTWMNCSPESHPYGCGTDASKINVYGKGVQGIPHVKKCV